MMSVDTPSATWVVPPDRAVWIPAGFRHAVKTSGVVRMQTVYLRPSITHRIPRSCCVLNVSPLLRELVLEALRQGMLEEAVPEHARLAGVLADQIAQSREARLQIRLPTDARARAVAETAQREIAVTKPIAVLARGSGASARTIERIFVEQTGMTFGRWQQQVKALYALERLAAGDSVTAAGFAVGYESTSAFITMFKRVVGTTPGHYLRRPRFGGSRMAFSDELSRTIDQQLRDHTPSDR